MKSSLEWDAMKLFDALSTRKKEKVLGFIRGLNRKLPSGAPGSVLAKYAGRISAGDLDAIEESIQSDCSRIEHEGW